MDNVTVTLPQPAPQTNFTSLISTQTIAVVSRLELSSGVVLTDVPIAYRTWGELDGSGSNCMVICHALTGSADVEDWWGPLMGPGLAFDPSRYFIFCANVLGSPYGTASPVTVNPATGRLWGPDFPATTPRDDVRLQKSLLDHLGVRSIAVVVGGSMGGMTCLEWPLSTPQGYVRNIVPIATCPRHSAWGISWGEAQRQSIYSDPKYCDGRYDAHDPPATGLAAARMAALLTYRSRDSFQARFGRKQMASKPGSNLTNGTPTSAPGPIFSAQSYLRYQGDKFVSRFDANCYIHLTRKLDSHDVDHGREGTALARVPPHALVVAIDTDGLFTLTDQQELADSMPDARLVIVESTDGHDGFLLEFEQINRHLLAHLHERLPELYRQPVSMDCEAAAAAAPAPLVERRASKASMFGEAESITNCDRFLVSRLLIRMPSAA